MRGAVVGGILAEKKQLLGVLSRAVFGCEGSDPTHPNPTLIHPDFKSELESTERNAENTNIGANPSLHDPTLLHRSWRRGRSPVRPRLPHRSLLPLRRRPAGLLLRSLHLRRYRLRIPLLRNHRQFLRLLRPSQRSRPSPPPSRPRPPSLPHWLVLRPPPIPPPPFPSGVLRHRLSLHQSSILFPNRKLPLQFQTFSLPPIRLAIVGSSHSHA